jgi:CDP-glycerol:poly(glycerophosphate) glycerophosphotransferase
VIDALAGAPHYSDHLSAVLNALPAGVRGSVMTSIEQKACACPTLVASYSDLKRAQNAGRTKVAIMEHGSGQSYGGRGISHGSYAGGRGREGASLFLHPGPHPAARDRAVYPKARVEVVGSPFLDTLPKREGTPDRTVAFTFHFNGAVCPETKTAFPAFFPEIVRLAEKYKLIGTAHPMLWNHGRPGRRIADRYRKYGIEPVESFAEVCRRADLLIADNTSAMFAFAATGRPVVVLNAPWYSRKVDHGLRFWEAAEVGVNCNDPAALGECVEEALADPPAQQAKREAALDLVYAYREGASQRAADVLMDWMQ